MDSIGVIIKKTYYDNFIKLGIQERIIKEDTEKIKI
tara:strand:+ start:228 stop:335 length:108 start_codon:yes stop_codon:yes gene_type:complete